MVYSWKPYVFNCNNCKIKFSNKYSFLKTFSLKALLGITFFTLTSTLMFTAFFICKELEVQPKTSFVTISIITFLFFGIGAFYLISKINKWFPLTTINQT